MLHRLIMGDRFLSIGTYLPLDDGALLSSDGSVDSSGGRGEMSLAQGKIVSGKSLGVKLISQPVRSEGMLGHHHQSAGAPVQPVDRSEQMGFLVFYIMIGYIISYRVLVMIRPGMNGHPCRLVEHQQMLVLVEQTQPALHRDDGGGGILRQRQDNGLTRRRKEMGWNRAPVHQHRIPQNFAQLGGHPQQLQNFTDLFSTKAAGYGIL